MSRKRVAIVGSGYSGIGALWALQSTDHDVYLYEADDRLGGHTNTVQWKHGKYTVDVDTGFVVLNTATYPNFINFLKHLQIDTEPTRMDLMWRMLFDIVRFNQFALDVLVNENNETASNGQGNLKASDTETIGAYLSRNGYLDAFRDGYLVPITAAVWSTSPKKCIDVFPTLTLIRFLWNHHQLSTVSTRPEWLTLKEGSRSYIGAVMKNFPSHHIFLNSPAKSISKNADGFPVLHLEDGRTDTYDHIVLAVHGDQALSILGSSATEKERSILSCFKISQNEVVLHSDLFHMPRRRNAWSSWNYLTLSPQSKGYEDQVSLTYSMNILQHIPEDKLGHVLVTLNPLRQPDPELTQGRFEYSHPLYTPEAVQAQKRLRDIQNIRGISYAEAWTNYGFHEDGFSSGLRAAQDHLGAKLPFEFIDSTLSRGAKPTLGIVDYFARFIIICIQLLVVQPLELLAGIERRPLGEKIKSVKQT